ncbi:MAG: hypothetical protein LBR77_02560 [Lachnospiraceae bacterium]|jgi:uncharacterized membrane protein HdeD (DUF308 family)|nr:hypothetical protein [Lachnospiraceae bacterium]
MVYSWRDERRNALIMDLVHIIIALAVVVMGVVSFIYQERFLFLFPAVFFLAAVLHGIHGIMRFRAGKKEKRHIALGVLCILVTLLLLGMSAVSAISMRR